jgi:hypothetical protein
MMQLRVWLRLISLDLYIANFKKLYRLLRLRLQLHHEK